MKKDTIANVLVAGLVITVVAVISEYDFPVMASRMYTIAGLLLIVGSIASIIVLKKENE